MELALRIHALGSLIYAYDKKVFRERSSGVLPVNDPGGHDDQTLSS